MKNFSLALNILLLCAVIFLFVKVYSPGKTAPVAEPAKILTPSGGISIAYVELDSMNEKINYIKARRTELEAEQKSIEADWQNGYRGLESKKNEFLKKGNAITQQEAEQFQNQLLQEQQVIDGKKQNLSQGLSEKSYKLMDDIQKKTERFFS